MFYLILMQQRTNWGPIYTAPIQLPIRTRISVTDQSFVYTAPSYPWHFLLLLSGTVSAPEQCKHFRSVTASATDQKLHRYSVNRVFSVSAWRSAEVPFVDRN